MTNSLWYQVCPQIYIHLYGLIADLVWCDSVMFCFIRNKDSINDLYHWLNLCIFHCFYCKNNKVSLLLLLNHIQWKYLIIIKIGFILSCPRCPISIISMGTFYQPKCKFVAFLEQYLASQNTTLRYVKIMWMNPVLSTLFEAKVLQFKFVKQSLLNWMLNFQEYCYLHVAKKAIDFLYVRFR